MKPFLTWLTLGAILFLFSCKESHYTARAYRPTSIDLQTSQKLQTTQPVISYSREIDTLYNDDFQLSFADDLRGFYNRVDAWAQDKAENQSKLTRQELLYALSVAGGPARAEDVSAARQLAMDLAMNTEQPY